MTNKTVINNRFMDKQARDMVIKSLKSGIKTVDAQEGSEFISITTNDGAFAELHIDRFIFPRPEIKDKNILPKGKQNKT